MMSASGKKKQTNEHPEKTLAELDTIRIDSSFSDALTISEDQNDPFGQELYTVRDAKTIGERLQNIVLPVDELEARTLKECYYIEKKIGCGGMAWVYRGLHTAFQAPIAVKFLFSEFAEDAEAYGQFLVEARLQFTLKHMNIVQVLDYIHEWGLVGCVMEWVEGGDLGVWLKQNPGPLSLAQIEQFILPVLDGISFAHSRKVVHCDLKPENILLHQEGDTIIPKIADFGLAKIHEVGEHSDSDGELTMPEGSLRTISPEQIRDSSDVDHRADIYSLGVILYRLVTGVYPFTGNAHRLIAQHLREEPVPPSHRVPALSPKLEEVILLCLAKERTRRFQSSIALKKALQVALSTPTSVVSAPKISAPAISTPAISVRPIQLSSKPVELPAKFTESSFVPRQSSAKPTRQPAAKQEFEPFEYVDAAATVVDEVAVLYDDEMATDDEATANDFSDLDRADARTVSVPVMVGLMVLCVVSGMGLFFLVSWLLNH